MNKRLPFQLQLFLGLMIGLLVGYLFQEVDKERLGGDLDAPESPTGYLYKNVDVAWKVKLTVFSDKPPIILAAEKIENARISSVPEGQNTLTLEDNAGNNLYSQTFQASFLITGIDKKLEEQQLIFVLPFIESARKITVTTPKGFAEYELPK